MSSEFSDFFGGGVGSSISRGWAMQVFAAKSITFPKSGFVRVAVQSAGGSGAATAGATSTCATGGNSGPWGVKVFRVAANDVLALSIGAGGARPATGGSNGLQGGTTTATLNGTTIITAQGGEGGTYRSSVGTADAPVPAATVTGCDFWVPGLRAGSATVASGGQSVSGGAASDILQSGLGRSPNATNNSVGMVGGSVGNDVGSPVTPYLALADWGLVSASGSKGPGQGGILGSIQPGFFGGGGSTNTASNNSYTDAIIGGGGGSGTSASFAGVGGAAYVYLQYETVA